MAIPSIIYKILSCGFINIFQITMLIFDECHHANLDHPYNKIMEERINEVEIKEFKAL